MSSPAARQKTLSATTLAVHHHLQCDLFLYNSYNGLGEVGTARHPRLSETTKATFSRGDKWEATLFAWLDKKGLLLEVLGGNLEGHEIQEVIEIDERDHFFVSGLSFAPPTDAFATKFRINNRQPVRFGLAKPDLVEIRKERGVIRWQVVDAKSSAEVKTSHHVQIYFYHVCLESLFLSSHYKAMGTAAVWIPPSIYEHNEPSFNELKSVPTPLLSLPLDDFLFKRLPLVLSAPRSAVKWHLNPLCRGCAYEHDCRSNAVIGGELGSMANISIQDAGVLKNVLAVTRSQSGFAPLTDIEDLYSAFNSKGTIRELDKNHSANTKKAMRILKIRGKTSPLIDAARLKQVQPLNKRMYTLPSNEDIAIVISLVLDPTTNALAAYYISTFSNLSANVSPGPLSGTPEDFISSLSSIVQYILDLNEVTSVPPRTQCYVFSHAERAALQRILIDASLTVDPVDDDAQDAIRMCIGALCEGAALLATAFQPLVLSGALLEFLGKKGSRTTAELQACLRRLGLSTKNAPDDVLRQRIQQELDRLRNHVKGGSSTVPDDTPSSDDNYTSGHPEVGQLPRVVVLKRAVEELLALPIAGYWDLPDCHAVLTAGSSALPSCPSDDAIYACFVANRKTEGQTMLQTRNSCIYEVLMQVRARVSDVREGNLKANMLVNEARVLTSDFMDICRQDHLRKLFFMQQFEVLAKLTNLWQARIDGCVDSPRLEYQHTRCIADGTYVHYFSLCSGYVDLPSDKERTFYSYILTEDDDSDVDIPVEALFDDLAVFNLVFPLNRYTMTRWTRQPAAVQKKVYVADVHDMVIREFRTLVVLRTFSAGGLHFKRSARYRLSPRLVDFNVTKVLGTLVELDLQTPAHPGYMSMPPFLQLFTDPRAFARLSSESDAVTEKYTKAEESISRTFRELSGLMGEAAAPLTLKPSQRTALKRLLKRRLSVIWGPPGTGKTYTISLSLLRLIEIRHKCHISGRLIILLTAMTHAAIRACMSKLRTLIQNYRQFPGMGLDWIDKIRLERVLSGALHPLPSDDEATYVFAGTVYQLYNYCKRTQLKADCIIIDEAGQLGLGPASLVLKSLQSNGRVVIAGDSEQLAPILTSQYPQAGPHLFGSILDCLMNFPSTSVNEPRESLSNMSTSMALTDSSTISTVVQLTENFRLNPDLGEFISTIYKRSFVPQKRQSIEVAEQLEKLADMESHGATDAVAKDILVALSAAMRRRRQNILKKPNMQPTVKLLESDTLGLPPISLVLIRLEATSSHLDQMGYETHVRGEAMFAAALVNLLQRAAPNETVFVATPHRIQRQAVKDALLSQVDGLTEAFGTLHLRDDEQPLFMKEKVIVDTIERLQGSEAAFVICLFSHTYAANVATAIDFLLERRRLNVAISRAKTLCILVTSQEILRPSVRVFANPQSAKGFAFLKAFEDRAWSTDVTVDLDELIVDN
ncbi:hypothetical protein M0805_008645 [Coniferiporia weirii]|nr:hypothetical protein M0805_008645 [Coniferiporia weirii]